jgi:outer membrane protein assembly factor BamE (lipoprotein component of BamABCDE complex)
MIQNNLNNGMLLGASLVILFLLFVATNSNQNNQSLERRVTALENRVTQLERGSQPAQSRPAQQTSNPWRRLQTNMTTDQVKNLLGEPTRVANIGGYIWYYPNFGTVNFNSSNRVRSWSEPRQ